MLLFRFTWVKFLRSRGIFSLAIPAFPCSVCPQRRAERAPTSLAWYWRVWAEMGTKHLPGQWGCKPGLDQTKGSFLQVRVVKHCISRELLVPHPCSIGDHDEGALSCSGGRVPALAGPAEIHSRLFWVCGVCRSQAGCAVCSWSSCSSTFMAWAHKAPDVASASAGVKSPVWRRHERASSHFCWTQWCFYGFSQTEDLFFLSLISTLIPLLIVVQSL